ncbi:MAG: FAD-binding protein [Candidatus Lambdaproteobacteria bacterium]|nr:FAD-binding protein [Candidatus Lambdaproteobacteria bacterium]
MPSASWETLETDVLVLGSGGAGLCAALHMADAGRPPRVTLAVKGLFGKSGCTRMVQGGYNVVLNPKDSLEAHFADTIKGGQWINNQELAWLLVQQAPGRVLELENRAGCFFDRDAEGNVHQKPFAGQSFDRTVHKGDLTGIEIINRLAEQVRAAPNTTILEEVRAVELLHDAAGQRIVGALLVNQRTGGFICARAKATLLATGGGPTMYKISAPCQEKSCDGIAMGYRAGATLMDMEMVQFHPTGLLVANQLISGTVLEEGLRGVGAHLVNGKGERFMHKYDPRGERATRDIVSRSCFIEVMEGRGTREEGVLLDASHLGAEFVLKNFKGMTLRCRDVGYDLTREPVPISPTAHFMMGGVQIDTRCRTELEGLFVAGEDAAGVHGANRLGGNGVAESTVFGGIAGDVIARWVLEAPLVPVVEAELREGIARSLAPFANTGTGSVYPLRTRLRETMWRNAGLVRSEATLRAAEADLDDLRQQLARVALPSGRAYNMAWMDALNLESYLDISGAIVRAALARRESRGSHFRSDFPEKDDAHFLCNLLLTRDDRDPIPQAIDFSRLKPDHPDIFNRFDVVGRPPTKAL